MLKSENKLKQMLSNGLTEKVAIYVPSTVNVNQSIDNSQFVSKVAIELSKLFGGATQTQAVGSWFSNDLNKLVTENVTIVYSNCNKSDLDKHLLQVVNIASQLCSDMTQECISLELNGVLHFID